MFPSVIICRHCQQPIPLRSFHPPLNQCPACGQLQDPELAQSRRGCLVMLPIAIASAAAFGYLAFHAGNLLGDAIQVPGLGPRLALMAAGDGFVLAGLIHVGGVRSRDQRGLLEPVAIFLIFTLIGIRGARGQGVNWLLLLAIANGLMGLAVGWTTLKLLAKPADCNADRK